MMLKLMYLLDGLSTSYRGPKLVGEFLDLLERLEIRVVGLNGSFWGLQSLGLLAN